MKLNVKLGDFSVDDPQNALREPETDFLLEYSGGRYNCAALNVGPSCPKNANCCVKNYLDRTS